MSLSNLRPVLIRDQPDRDAISSRLTRYLNESGDGWAEIVDMRRWSYCTRGGDA